MTAKPAAHDNLAVTLEMTASVSHAWQDNAANETSFRVQRSTDGQKWITLANLAANSKSYTTTPPGQGVALYDVRGLAVNDAGKSISDTCVVTSVQAAPLLSAALDDL